MAKIPGWRALFTAPLAAVVLSIATLEPSRSQSLPASPDSLPLQQRSPLENEALPEVLRLENTELVPITLSELIQLTLQGNRNLQDAQLQRIVQRQQLNAAEQTFNPRITPRLSLDLAQDFAGSDRSADTFFDESAEVRAEMDTRLGTRLSLGLDPLDNQRLSVGITQPLLRGFGRTVNEAPVVQARLAESSNQLALQQQVIDTVTSTVTQYTALIQAQESVKIQAQALERRQRELERQQALVRVGREAGVSLLDYERLVADADRQLISAQNNLVRANTSLRNLVGTDQPLQFVALLATVDQLFATATAQSAQFDQARLIEQAYQVNPEYLQAQLQQQSQALDLTVAQDNLRWQLNLRGESEVGNLSQGRLGLVATRQFDDPALETQRVRSEVALRQGENRLARLREQLRNDVTNRLLDVRSNLAQVEAATRARQSAERQLAVTRARFGQGDATSFEVSTQEENLVAAQNAELNARITFLNSIALLEQTVGITVESWQPQVDFSPVLTDAEAQLGP